MWDRERLGQREGRTEKKDREMNLACSAPVSGVKAKSHFCILHM